MLINKLTLKNFRSYEDEFTFNFTPTAKKNIVLIGGENGAGKSTIFEAIKLCFYGPSTYGYQGFNSNYISKIKSNINNNALRNKSVASLISLDITLPEGNSNNSYLLERSWKYSDKRITETFNVYKNGVLLTETEVLYFENYFNSLLPPMLFDFFFFDGEELSDFFIGSSSKTHIKDALLKLCNYDTIDILRKHIIQYQRSEMKSKKSTNILEENYNVQKNTLNEVQNKIKSVSSDIKIALETLDELKEKYKTHESEFRNQGGILEEERNSLNNKIYSLENNRTNTNQDIKDFCNETLPLLLLSDELNMLKVQLEKEDSYSVYKKINSSLTTNAIKEFFSTEDILSTSSTEDEVAVSLVNTISKKMFGNLSYDNFKEIHKLSPDQNIDVQGVINNISSKNMEHRNFILNQFDSVRNYTSELESTRAKLTSSLDEEYVNEFLKTLSDIQSKITQVENNLTKLEMEHESLFEKEKNIQYHLTRAKNEYLAAVQADSSLGLTNKVTDLLDTLISRLTDKKLKEIEVNYMDIFSKLIRKNKYVEDISIDKDFNINLYINRTYNSFDISNQYKNMGYDEMNRKFGSKFMDGLYSHFSCIDKKELTKVLNNITQQEFIELETKVSITEFSKGEKQVYILCLIWALIKSSEVKVPFIIDTPYARIDESHRHNITTEFLPNVSNQVIILSTNKEIDHESYNLIKENLSNEYLLEYMDHERKTKVSTGYFFEV